MVLSTRTEHEPELIEPQQGFQQFPPAWARQLQTEHARQEYSHAGSVAAPPVAAGALATRAPMRPVRADTASWHQQLESSYYTDERRTVLQRSTMGPPTRIAPVLPSSSRVEVLPAAKTFAAMSSDASDLRETERKTERGTEREHSPKRLCGQQEGGKRKKRRAEQVARKRGEVKCSDNCDLTERSASPGASSEKARENGYNADASVLLGKAQSIQVPSDVEAQKLREKREEAEQDEEELLTQQRYQRRLEVEALRSPPQRRLAQVHPC